MNSWIFIAIFGAALAVYAMMDILRAKITNRGKMIWFAVVVLIPILGAIIYLLKRPTIERAS